jgi:DnaK suppressor protein
MTNKLKKTFIKKMKAQLLQQRQELLRQIGQDIDIDQEGDECDVIQGNQLVQLTKELNSRATQKISLIDQALKRIEEQRYGLCAECEELIAEKRLEIAPHILTCVECAEELELLQRKEGRN